MWSSASKKWIKVTSDAAWDNALQLASVLDLETTTCFLEDHETKLGQGKL